MDADSANGADGATVIAAATTVTGRIGGSADLCVHGRLEGDVGIGGVLTIERDGVVSGDAVAQEVHVHGAIAGDVRALVRVHIGQTGRVVGDVTAPRLVLEPGARLAGQVESGDEGAATRVPARDEAATEHVGFDRVAPRAAAEPTRGWPSRIEPTPPPAPPSRTPVRPAASRIHQPPPPGQPAPKSDTLTPDPDSAPPRSTPPRRSRKLVVRTRHRTDVPEST